jgi:DNA-binding HxlR family transcriptional regulator
MGLVKRSVLPTAPPRVEYALTPLGQTLLQTVTELTNWATHYGREIQQSRVASDEREAEETRARTACTYRACATKLLPYK